MRVGLTVMGFFAAALCAPATAGAQRGSGSIERAHREGKQAFAAGDYETAAARFDEAYLLSDDPTYLFNLAQAQRLNGDCRAAFGSYREFLDKVPDAPNRADVEDKLAALEGCARPPARLMPTPVPQPAAARRELAITASARATPPPRRKRTGLWVAAGGGLVLAASVIQLVAADAEDASALAVFIGIPVGAGLFFGGAGQEILAWQRAHPDL